SSPFTTTETPPEQEETESPLTDSNRRPPPYHLEPRAEARARAGHRRPRKPRTSKDLKRGPDPRVPARGRSDVRVSFARLVGCMDNASACDYLWLVLQKRPSPLGPEPRKCDPQRSRARGRADVSRLVCT